jgi:hypothetical protein
MTQNKITLNTLLTFIRENENDIFNDIQITLLNEYLEDTKSTWSKGRFFLGGHLGLRIDDEITLDMIDKVKKQHNQLLSNDACNSIELMSLNTSIRKLNDFENIIIKFMEIKNMQISQILLEL